MIKQSRVSLRSLAGVVLLTAGILAAAPAGAQDGNVVLGGPQVRDFQLEPKQRIVTQPRPQPVQPTSNAQQPAQGQPATASNAGQPQPAQQRPAATARASGQAQAGGRQSAERSAAPAAAPAAAAPSAAQLASGTGAAPATALPAPEPVIPLPAPAAPITGASTTLSDGPPLWVFFLAFVTLGLLGYGYYLRRQAVERRALALPAPVVAPPRAPAAPRPAPVPRPWLELALRPERARIDLDESVIEFELTIRNSGGSIARDIKLQARMFCSTPEQDQELSTYFKSKVGDNRTIAVPDVPAGGELVIMGQVDITRDRLKALQTGDKLLFVPLIGVNAFYSWGTSRSGQTSRSFIVGREPQSPGDKMAPFRLDLGARVYRTVGQREHNVSRRV